MRRRSCGVGLEKGKEEKYKISSERKERQHIAGEEVKECESTQWKRWEDPKGIC